MKLRAAGVITALFVALGSTTYPTGQRPGGLSVAPPAHPRADPATQNNPGDVGPVQDSGQAAPSTPEKPPMQQTPPGPTSPHHADRTAQQKQVARTFTRSKHRWQTAQVGTVGAAGMTNPSPTKWEREGPGR